MYNKISELMKNAKKAQQAIDGYTQEQVDALVRVLGVC